ncbi:MAG TPA: sigma-70 family RNA polymerase sigma factor [Gaiellales bacterium]|jgi:RNA polymerase sigma factor (sigma-70 family)
MTTERRDAPPPEQARTLDELYREHAPGLERHCLRLTGSRDAADDLVQEVFVRFLARFPVAPAEMNVGAYLHATAKNVLWKQLRDRHEVPDDRIEDAVGADDDIEVDPERAVLLHEQRHQVRRCAALLTGHQQRALTLREVEGRSYAEIGGTLGLGSDAVAQVIARGRARMRVVLRRAQIDVDSLDPACQALLAPLSAYLDGQMSQEAEISAHLASCERCRATLASYKGAGFRLRGLAPLAPIAGALARVGGVVRLGADGAGLVAASIATAGVIALSGGGILLARHETHTAAAPPPATTAIVQRHAAPAIAAPPSGSSTLALQTAAAASPSRTPVRPATTTRLRAHHAPAHRAASGPVAAPPATTAPDRSVDTPTTSTPVTAGAPPTSDRTPTTPTVPAAPRTPTTPAVPLDPTDPAGATGGVVKPVTKAVDQVLGVVKHVVTVPVDLPPVSVPSVTTPAITTPSVSVPAVTVPSVTTPSVATPVVTVPPVTTPAISTPSVSLPPLTTPVVTTPAINLPGVHLH